MYNKNYKNKRDELDLIFLAILLCGLLLRLYNLGKYSFWLDEAINLLLSPKYLWAGLMDQSFKMPELSLVSLFPTLVHFWKYLGKSEFVLRLLPLAFGILSIIGTYMVAKLLFNKKIAQLSAFILSISPFHVYYSQELKYNTLIVFLTIFSVYFYIKSLKEDKPIFWFSYITFILLDLYSFFITIFLLISLNAHYLFYFNKYKKLVYKWLATQVSMFFFLIPWIIRIFQQILNPDQFSLFAFIQKPSLSTLFYSFRTFNIGYGASIFIGYSAGFLCLALFILGILSIARDKERVSLLLIWFLMPIFLIYIVSLVIKPIFLERALIYVTPAYYIVLACGLAGVKNKLIWIPLFLFTLLSFVSLRNQFENTLPLASVYYRGSVKGNLPRPFTPIYHPGVRIKVENKLAANYIERNFQEGDVIGHPNFHTMLPFIYYHSSKFEEKYIGEINPNNINFYHFHFGPIRQKQFSFVDIKQFTKGKKRIWVVISLFGVLDRQLPIRYPKIMAQLENWIDKNCNLIDSKDFLGIKVNLYQIKSE